VILMEALRPSPQETRRVPAKGRFQHR
jgi:hypothetical protein